MESSRPGEIKAERRRRGEADVAPDLSVAIILAPDFTLLPFAGFVEALRHAADEADRSRQIYCRWTWIGPELRPVRSSCGVEVVPRETFGDPCAFDYIVVVGGLLPSFRKIPEATIAYLRRAAAAGVPLVGLCTGSFVLAEAGLLDGRRCAVHWRHRQDLVSLFPEAVPVSDETYVIDDRIITCPGGTAAIDLATELIIRHCGRARALKGLHDMVVDQHRAAHHVPRLAYGDVASCGDPRVERAVALMEQNLSGPFAIAELALRLGTTTRQLDRAFARHVGAPPAAFWRDMRLAHARWLLLNTSRSVTQVAFECGFADAAHFARWFKRSYGELPYRFRALRREASVT